jgi:NAD(P)-dependent dehydrogenase (short-subunit alcohol dehydrogenase family)
MTEAPAGAPAAPATTAGTPVWFVTGCSTGLGRALAEAVLARGDRAVVTARDAGSVAGLAGAHPGAALALALDVTDGAQVTDAVAAAEDRFGRIDVLVNNAGYGYRAAVEEGDEADVARLFATNVFGPVALMKAVLPGMRARRSGAVVNISSIAARLCPPGSGYYAAAKAALEGISGAARKELAPLGISVTAVEPGGFRTDFAGRSLTQSAVPIADYSETAGKRRKEHDTYHGTQPGDPARAARAIIAAVEAEATPAFLLLGQDALAGYRATAAAQAEEVAAWEPVSGSTGFQ